MIDILAEQEISNYGFQSYDFSMFGTLNRPLSRLPNLPVWEEVLRRLPHLEKTNRLTHAIENIIPFNVDNVQSLMDIKRAYYILSLIHITLNEDNRIIDAPLDEIHKLLDHPTFNPYYSLILYNWTLKCESKPLDHENIHINHTLTNIKDEERFYKIHILMESKSLGIAKSILDVKESIEVGDYEKIIQLLKDMTTLICEMSGIISELNSLNYEQLNGVFGKYKRARFTIDQSPLYCIIEAFLNTDLNTEKINRNHGYFVTLSKEIDVQKYIEENKHYDYELKISYDDCQHVWSSFKNNYRELTS